MNSNFDNASLKTKNILKFIAVLSVILLIWLFFSFKDIYKGIDFTNILLAIIGASATILSIVFALSQFILQNVSKKYSPKILDEYENNPKTHMIIFLYLGIIASSLPCLVLKGIQDQLGILYLLLFSSILFTFIIALIYLLDYIKLMFIYTNPFKYSDLKKSEVNAAIKTKNKDRINNGFIIIGDISIKALIDNEEGVTKHSIQNFMDILSDHIGVEDNEQRKST